MGLEYKIYHTIIGFPSISEPRIKKAMKQGWNYEEAAEMDKFMVNGLLEIIPQYSIEAVEKLILSHSVLGKMYKKIKDKDVLLGKIDKYAKDEMEFTNHLENTSKKVEFVVLSTQCAHAIYCNGMFMPWSRDQDEKSMRHFKFALRNPYKEVYDNEQLEKYYSEKENFPKWLKELDFLIL